MIRMPSRQDDPTDEGCPDSANLLQEPRPEITTPAPLPSDRAAPAVPLRALGVALGLALLVAFLGKAGDLLPSWDNPLEQKTVDRSTQPLLLTLSDLNEYHAATGSFQVVIDRERDTRFLPSVISGERVTFLATGTVDAYVDFTGLGAERVKVSADRRSVTINLPAARLGQVTIDPGASGVLDRDRGALDRIGDVFAEDPSVEGQFYAIGERKLTAAAEESNLLRRAEANTRVMLTALSTSLGFTKVTVTFDSPA